MFWHVSFVQNVKCNLKLAKKVVQRVIVKLGNLKKYMHLECWVIIPHHIVTNANLDFHLDLT